MRVIILKDYTSVSEWVAHYVYNKVHNNKCVLGLPTGSTPIQVYKNLIDMKTNFENVTTFNMVEYIGLPPDHIQSYHYFMNYYLFNKTKFLQNILIYIHKFVISVDLFQPMRNKSYCCSIPRFLI